MAKRLWMLAGMLALAGCAAGAGPGSLPASPPTLKAIRYTTEACFGKCPVYTLEVRADLTGSFDGKHFTKVAGHREFRVSRPQFEKFRQVIEPHRPESGSRAFTMQDEGCGVTDMPSVDVRWIYSDGTEQQLIYYYGCDPMGKSAISTALHKAPTALPVSELVGH